MADPEASLAAEIFYGELAAGARVDRALAKTYEQLMTKPRDYAVRDWHKLRLYVGDRLPGALVVPLRLRKTKKARLAESAFLDGSGLVKVASRSTFVGRRRVLQRVLQGEESVGVMLHGLGGNGKSSVAARLCDRLASSALGYQRVVIFGMVDEAGFVNAFGRALDREPDCVAILNESGALRSRLVRVLEKTERNWLFVMDDFEALSGGESLNLDEVGGAYVMKPGVAALMGDLTAAVWECGGGRVVITSRYEVAGLARLVRVPVGPMDDREMLKKRRQLEYVAKILAAVESERGVMRELQSRAEGLADGNPRLLMWLDRVLCAVADPREILGALEARALEFREDVLAEKLLALLSRKEREALVRGLVFELAVPRGVFEEVVEFGEFRQAVALGLLAVSLEGDVRVVRLLGLAVPQDEALAAKAAREIYRAWENSESEVQRLEIHRLAIEGKVGTIAAEVNQSLAPDWNRNNRYRETVAICRRTLELCEDHRVFHSLAYAEDDLGEIESCLTHYQKAIDLCPKSEQEEIATLMHNKAVVYVNQGNVEGAIVLYEESLQIQRAIGHQQGIAATLNQIANVYVNQGNVEGAIVLYEESLQIQRAIGNAHGIASTLAMLAQIIVVHQQDFGTAIDYRPHSEAILRRIGSPMADQVVGILQQVEGMKNLE